MKIELWKSREVKFIIITSLLVGVVVGSFYPNAQGFQGILSVYQRDFVLPKDVSVSARSLKNTTRHSFSFPPQTLVFESLEFMVDVSDVSGGLLHVNLTKDGNVMRSETVYPWTEKTTSDKIILVHDEHRLGYSETDVVLWATDDVRLSRLWIQIHRGDREHHPLLMALQFVAAAYCIIVPIVEKAKNRRYRWPT